MQTLPVINKNANHQFFCDLDGVSFGFLIQWNEREEAYYLSLSDSAGSDILSGQKLALGVPVLRNCVDPRRPFGELLVLDTSNADEESGVDDLGARVIVVYIEKSDFAITPDGFE